jgi:hypothetical protein
MLLPSRGRHGGATGAKRLTRSRSASGPPSNRMSLARSLSSSSSSVRATGQPMSFSQARMPEQVEAPPPERRGGPTAGHVDLCPLAVEPWLSSVPGVVQPGRIPACGGEHRGDQAHGSLSSLPNGAARGARHRRRVPLVTSTIQLRTTFSGRQEGGGWACSDAALIGTSPSTVKRRPGQTTYRLEPGTTPGGRSSPGSRCARQRWPGRSRCWCDFPEGFPQLTG